MRKLFNIIPEFYFIGLGIFWLTENYLSSGRINYVAVLVMWLMFLQVIYKNRILGLSYGVIMALASVYMIVATLNEFAAFESFTVEAAKLLGVGAALFGSGLIMGVAMLYKYATAKVSYDESVLTVTY